jgi:hypothetical protein
VKNSSLFNEFVCNLDSFHSSFKLAHLCQKKPYNVFLFDEAPNRWKCLKLVWRFVLTSCQIYQNPFTEEKILKFWQCGTKKETFITCCTHYFFAYPCKLRNLVQKDLWKITTKKKVCFDNHLQGNGIKCCKKVLIPRFFLQKSTSFTTILRVKNCATFFTICKI